MALERAERVLSQNTRTDEVNLEGMGLTTIVPLLPLFSQMTRLRRVRLGRNALTSLPEDLSALRNLDTLDLAGNPIAGLSSILRGLQCIPGLKHLNVDLPFESEEDEVIVTLSSLESFNGTSLTDTADEDAAPPPVSHTSKSVPQAWVNDAKFTSGSSNPSSVSAKTRWEESDTVQVQRLHQAVNSLSGRPASKQEFDDYTRSVVGHLNSIVSSEEDPLRREGEILKSKKILFEYCFEEAVRAAQRADPALGQVLSLVQDSYGGLLNNYDRLTKNIIDTKEKKMDAMKIDLQGAIQEIEGLMQQLEAKGAQGGDGAAASRFDGERRKWTEEIGWLRTENEKLQTRIRQLELSRQGAPSASPVAGSRALSGGGTTFGAQSTDRSGQSPARATPPPLGSKVLTLRQLRDTVEDIYASKSKYDIKCAETHLPRETMEQHMYTYLNQRYGLKHIILEWATAIIQGIKKFSAEDNDVAVFGKILRNEVDEEFRFVQRQLKETVHELLRVYVKGKKPLKSDEEINQMVRKKVSGTILEEEWVDIVKYMYNNEDAVTIIMRIRDILKQQAQPRRSRRSVPTSRSRTQQEEEPVLLSYNEFIRILLDFQLEGHERFLSRFVRIFKQHDADRNGIVNEQEFRAILRSVDPGKSEEEVTALLDLIDPHNNQLINFSECVTFLSSELVKMMREEGPA